MEVVKAAISMFELYEAETGRLVRMELEVEINWL